MNGLITKGIGGFYYVKTEQGVIQTRGRGIFRKTGMVLKVGDLVELSVLDDGDGVIEKIQPRTSDFDRPPIANVDTMGIVFSVRKPKPNYEIIDKFLIMAGARNTEALLILNKTDLAKPGEAEAVRDRFRGCCPVICVSAQAGEGIPELKDALKGRKTALAGFSGVGKSTITNALIPDAAMDTGGISTRTARGKHTTRHVEIFDLPEGGILYDTPGFLSLELDLSDVMPDDLSGYYPEIAALEGECRFDNCRHLKEPDCRIREAVEDGRIDAERYRSYVTNYQELLELSKDWNRRKNG